MQFARRPVLIFVVPFLFLLLISAVIVLIFLSGDPGKDPYPPPDAAKESALPVMGDVKHTPTIEILPEPERPVPTKNPFESPGAFSSSLRLTGIISGSTGSSAAIVVAGDRSYIVQVGDEIGKTGWSVTEINEDGIVLSDGETERPLELIADQDE